MKVRAMRRMRPTRYMGPTDYFDGEPVNVAMVNRWIRKIGRRDARILRRRPRPKLATRAGQFVAGWQRRLADPRTWPKEMR